MAINDNFIQELRMKTDVNDIISTYVDLKKRGRTFVGLCPFHNEKTPSFTVYPDTQSYYCFGCGAGGDAITFLKNIEHLDYVDAVKSLAQRVGIQMPEDNSYDESLSKKRRKILSINRDTAKFFHEYLLSPQGKAGLDYYLSRGLTMKTINHFGLGFAPNDWSVLTDYLIGQGYTKNDIADAGVVRRSDKGHFYDLFRNRVMTPIIDVRGNVIAFGGRVLDDSKPKYINTGDTLVYKKTNEVFAMNFAKDSGQESVILCEGYMDVISMHQAGFTNSVAGCGTALTNEQVRLISRYFKEVILCYDADEAGQKALKKAMDLFSHTDLKIRIPKLVGGKDPDEIIRTYGRDKFKGMLDGASNEIEFLFLNIASKHDLTQTSGKIDYINDAIKILATVTPVEQDLYISKISEELSVEKRNIKAQFDEYKRRYEYRSKKREYQKIVDNTVRTNAKMSYENGVSVKQIKAQDRIIGLLLKYPDCINCTSKLIEDALSSGFAKKIYLMVTERINNNESVELMDFSGKLTDEEIGRLSGIIARNEDSKNPKKEFSDCITTINDEYEKSKKDSVNNMSDDEFRNLFNKNT